MKPARASATCPRRLLSFGRDNRAASAVEFAIVAGPFIMLMLGTLQVGVYYYAQSALDAGLIKTADSLRSAFTTGTTPVLPTATTLKSNVATYSGGMIRNDANLLVEIRRLTALDGAVVPITDGVTDYGDNVTKTSTLVLRGQATITTFAPGFSGLARATSSALVRRQGK